MDRATIRLYDQQAAELSARYESADMSGTHRILLRHLPEHGSVLEVGCGSGRDAAFLVHNGFDVTAIDASAQMLAVARRHHLELADRLHNASLPFPTDSPFLSQQFEGVVSIATIMHVPDQDLFECASQIRDMLVPGGMLVLSASIGREGVADNRDPQGRLFIERPAEELQLLFERLGFRLVAKYENEDSFNRSVRWYTLVMQRAGGKTPRSVDEIETIITRDKKVATYKLALLRALCEIAQTESHIVTWRPDGTVSVPLGLVAEKWLLYYWPIIELDLGQDKRVVMPQTQGMETNRSIAFRQPMRDLIRFYGPHGGLSAMHHDYKAGSTPSEGLSLLDLAMNTIARTIVTGPVTHAGGALKGAERYFGFEGRRSASHHCTDPTSACNRLGRILVPAGTWREMCLIGHWVAESLVLRWAELTRKLSNRTVAVKDVVERLLIIPETERDVHFARTVYGEVEDLCCVWTDKPLKARFEVDHTVPFSVWHNNDLWNLLPAASSVNSRKSDKLVTKSLLLSRREAIIHYWEILMGAAESRFTVEVGRSLIRGGYDRANWQRPAFAGLVENVESLALQRGLERWEPS